MKKPNRTWVVIPAYNEEKTLGEVITNLKKNSLKNIIVINDGSEDRTEEVAVKMGAKVYSHLINRGLGGALNTGISAALLNGAEIIATCDADGQHNPEDVKRAIDFLDKDNLDVVIGSRLLNPEGMPFLRRIGNKGFNFITFLLFGIYSTDTQSGLRVFSKKAAEKLKIKTSKMEVSSEIIKEIGRNKLNFKEISIKAIYTDYSMEKGQKNTNAFNILYKLFLRRAM
ncbi:MAG: glycosyltransferase family 2 protein [Nanoarchaeota archaeon]|nr:glycosyltransferase family 2 protein [Nanoarchaeota archaeon]MBU1051198.1 glycosyltransferase family 2 protein [Nanoarchaeota archaeon]MBU1988685.1 glycosyltransferase family 2 protein [Nanoarchaeota archaeon]